MVKKMLEVKVQLRFSRMNPEGGKEKNNELLNSPQQINYPVTELK